MPATSYTNPNLQRLLDIRAQAYAAGANSPLSVKGQIYYSMQQVVAGKNISDLVNGNYELWELQWLQDEITHALGLRTGRCGYDPSDPGNDKTELLTFVKADGSSGAMNMPIESAIDAACYQYTRGAGGWDTVNPYTPASNGNGFIGYPQNIPAFNPVPPVSASPTNSALPPSNVTGLAVPSIQTFANQMGATIESSAAQVQTATGLSEAELIAAAAILALIFL
jgi:hypothetical protein